MLTKTRQSCLLQELNRLQGFKIKSVSSVESTGSFFGESPEYSSSYMLTFQIMLSPKHFLLNAFFLSTFPGLSTTVQFY